MTDVSPQEIAVICILRKNKYNIHQIADAMQREPDVVSAVIKAHVHPTPKLRRGKRDHDPEFIKAVCALWAEGRSGTEIAALYQNKITRNAIIGIVHRHGARRQDDVHLLSKLRTKSKKRKALEPPSTSRRDMAEALRPEPYLVLPDDPPLVANIVDIEDDQCLWPIGDPKDKESFGFCGKRRHSHYFSYCVNHIRRSVPQPPPPPGQTAANDSQPRHRIVEAAE